MWNKLPVQIRNPLLDYIIGMLHVFLYFVIQQSECGDGNGKKGICEECDDGYYQDQTVTRGPCNRCSSCDSNRIVLTNCTKTTNTECGPCKEG